MSSWKFLFVVVLVSILCGPFQKEAIASEQAQTVAQPVAQPTGDEAAPVHLSPAHLSYDEGYLSADLDAVALETVLNRISDLSGVTFEIQKTNLKYNPITIKLDRQPLSEAVAAILADYNTFFIWDEDLNLLNVKIFDRSPRLAEPLGQGTIALSHEQEEPAHPGEADAFGEGVDEKAEAERIDRALAHLASSDLDRQFAAVHELVGRDDPRIPGAILDVALSPAAMESVQPEGGSAAEASPHPIQFEAALALWRHGIARGFADPETLDALEILAAQGDEATSAIARQALEDRARNF